MRLPLILLSASVLSLSACSYNSDPMGKPLPDLNYTHLTPISVNGGSFNITRSYLNRKNWREPNAPEQKTSIDNFSMPLDSSVERYVASRFKTDGEQPNVVLNIEKADITYIPSVRDNDVYRAFVFLTFTKVNHTKHAQGAYNLTVKKTLQVPPYYSLAEREFAQFEFVESIIQEIDSAVDVIVNERLR